MRYQSFQFDVIVGACCCVPVGVWGGDEVYTGSHCQGEAAQAMETLLGW